MKTIGDISYELENKEDLAEFLSKATFSFLPPIESGVTQAGGYIGDVRIHLVLLEFVKDQLQDTVALRSKDPDLMKQFNDVVNELISIRDKFNKNHEIIKKHN